MASLPYLTFGALLLVLFSVSNAFVPSHTVDVHLSGDALGISTKVAHNLFARPVSLAITTHQGAFSTSTSLHVTKKLKRDESLSSPASYDHALHRGRMLFRCQLAIVAYLLTGVIAFSRIFERWPITDALYFAVVTFTTVGYGDLCPTTDAGKLFAIFFSFAGISIVGALLGYIGGSIIEAERAAIRKTRATARAAIMELFDPAKKRAKRREGSKKDCVEDESSAESRVPNAFAGEINGSGTSTANNSGLGMLRRIVSGLFRGFTDTYYIFVPFVGLAAIIGRHEGWSTITSMYYAMATATTVGWGDVSPSSQQMRLLSLVFIPLAVISLGEILGRIAGFFIQKNTAQAEKEFMTRRMTLDDLDAMDTDKNG